MPTLRPFRALRFDAAFTDLAAVLAPPYDIISPAERLDLLARDPHNAVRLDLPADVGRGGADDYAAAAATLEDWRSEGILVKDAEPTLTLHEMSWDDGAGGRASAAGLFARLKLEHFGPGSGVLPHERTHAGPKQDRYQLLEATRLNTSPLVFLAAPDDGTMGAALSGLMARPPDAATTTPDGVQHRLWIIGATDEAASSLLDAASSQPITIADGHHRYETALSFMQDQQRATSTDEGALEDGGASAGEDPAWAYVMALVYPIDRSPPALPTHRVVGGGPCGPELLDLLAAFGSVEAFASAQALRGRMAEPVGFEPGQTGSGRIGIYTRDGHTGMASLLHLDRRRIGERLDPALSAASRGLDVNALGVLFEAAYGEEPGVLAAEGRLSYVKDAIDATARVDDGSADTCFLLDLMPASAISSVAAAGEVMPQKSTYFDPKAPTGLLFSPLEW